MNRREFLFATVIATYGPANTLAQSRPMRIAVLAPIDRDKSAFFVPFIQRLADLGFKEGVNLSIDYRSSSGTIQRIPVLARELVATSPDLIIALGVEQPARALLELKAPQPIVFIAVNYDPVDQGIVKSYSRPGGKFTGVYIPQAALAVKRLELLREMLPKLNRVLVMSDADSRNQLAAVKKAAGQLQLNSIEFTSQPYGIEDAFESGRAARSQAFLNLASPTLQVDSAKIADLALKYRLPAIGFLVFQAELGYLATFGAEAPKVSERAAALVARILKGEKPADLPVEQANEYELAINLKTAKTLGVAIPQSILFRADRVIE
jgi:putative tryptophan/tyrosine transport system substrate-binding protein